MLRNVMVTVDGSELSEKALGYTQDLIAPDGTIRILSVVDVPDATIYGAYPLSVSPEYYQRSLESAKSSTNEYVKKLADELRVSGYKVETEVAVGEAADMIINKANEHNVEAIVISTHGRTGFNQWLFGSVTQKVLSRMPCPVFVVPGRKVANRPPNRQAQNTPRTDG